LKAQGTKDQPITLTSIILGQYWNGITFWGKNSVGATQLNHLIVEYAGANNIAAIWFSDCYPNIDNITNSTIRYSQTNGIRFSNNSFLAKLGLK
jgi:hypothetical protein